MELVKLVVPQRLYDELRLQLNASNHRTLVFSDTQRCELGTPENQVRTSSSSVEASPIPSERGNDEDEENTQSVVLEVEKDVQGICETVTKTSSPAKHSTFKKASVTDRYQKVSICCPKCLRTYTRTITFERHKKICHRLANKKKITYPRTCPLCNHSYSCKATFSAHKATCLGYKKRLKNSSGWYVPDSHDLETSEIKPPVEKTKPIKKEVCRYFPCTNCERSYATKFAYKRHLKRCDYFKMKDIEKQEKEAAKNNVSADNSPAEDDKPVKWIPLTPKPTTSTGFKYFVVSKTSSS